MLDFESPIQVRRSPPCRVSLTSVSAETTFRGAAILAPRTTLEVADIFRGHGPAWRSANAGHVSLGQLKVMSAIEDFRTAALGGHVARCENEKCGHTQIGYNSCLMGKSSNRELAATLSNSCASRC